MSSNLVASNSTSVTDSRLDRSSSFRFLKSSNRYVPRFVPSVTACAAARASSPPMPPPCTTVVTVLANLRTLSTAAADAVLTAFRSKSSRLPNPTTSTRLGPAALLAPWRCISVVAPNLPDTSESPINVVIKPFKAASAAPVAPLGFATPSNRFTIATSALTSMMSPCVRLIFIAVFASVSGDSSVRIPFYR